MFGKVIAFERLLRIQLFFL